MEGMFFFSVMAPDIALWYGHAPSRDGCPSHPAWRNGRHAILPAISALRAPLPEGFLGEGAFAGRKKSVLSSSFRGLPLLEALHACSLDTSQREREKARREAGAGQPLCSWPSLMPHLSGKLAEEPGILLTWDRLSTPCLKQAWEDAPSSTAFYTHIACIAQA